MFTPKLPLLYCSFTCLHVCVIKGSSELSSDELLVLQSLVSVLLPLLRYVTADVENSQEVCVLDVLYYVCMHDLVLP